MATSSESGATKPDVSSSEQISAPQPLSASLSSLFQPKQAVLDEDYDNESDASTPAAAERAFNIKHGIPLVGLGPKEPLADEGGDDDDASTRDDEALDA